MTIKRTSTLSTSDHAAASRRLRGAAITAGRLERVAVAIAVGVGLTVSAAGCGDDAGAKPKAANLKAQLPPASDFPGYRETRSRTWTEAVDLGTELHRPAQTLPSVQLKALEKAGFLSAASAEFRGPKDRNHFVSIVQLKSPDGARELLEYQYNEELKQPCAAACSEQPGDVPVPGIPGAKGARQVPTELLPKNALPPFTASVVLFTVGANLYLVDGQGTGDDPAVEGETLDAARALYARVR